MKRLTALVLTGMIFATSVVVSAEIPDISNLTIQELYGLQLKIKEHLSQSGEAVILNDGDYAVGKDIAAGTYDVTVFYKDPDSSVGYNSLRIEKYPGASADYEKLLFSGDEHDKNDYIIDDWFLAPSVGTIRIMLEEGQGLSASNRSDVFTIIEKSTNLFMD